MPDGISTETIVLDLVLLCNKSFLIFLILDIDKTDFDLGYSHSSLLSAGGVGKYYHAQLYPLS